MKLNHYTKEQYVRCLQGCENNESIESIAKATGILKATVQNYRLPKNRDWLKQKAAGINIRAESLLKRSPVVFRSAALNEIYDRLSPVQKDRFEQAIIDVVLSKAFLP